MKGIHEEFMQLAEEHRLDTDHHILVIGNLHMSIEPDGAVVEVVRPRLFHIRPRGINFKDNGDFQITDDHPEWLTENNESERISKQYIDLMVVVSNVDSLTVPPAVDYVLTLPDVSVPESVEVPIDTLVALSGARSQEEAYNRYTAEMDK